MPSGTADHGAGAWGSGPPPAAPDPPLGIQVECRGAKVPKSTAAVSPAAVADIAMVNVRRSLATAA